MKRLYALALLTLAVLSAATAQPPEGRSLPLRVLVHLENIADTLGREAQYCGTLGEARRLEGFQIDLLEPVPGLRLEYTATLGGIGAVPWVRDGEFVGTRGQSRPMSSFAIRATGPAASDYDILYNAHVGDHGDTRICRNGELCGGPTGARVEGMTIWLVRRDRSEIKRENGSQQPRATW